MKHQTNRHSYWYLLIVVAFLSSSLLLCNVTLQCCCCCDGMLLNHPKQRQPTHVARNNNRIVSKVSVGKTTTTALTAMKDEQHEQQIVSTTTTNALQKLLIVGFGRVGKEIVKQIRRRRQEHTSPCYIVGTVQKKETKSSLVKLTNTTGGLDEIVDFDSQTLFEHAKTCTHILVTIPAKSCNDSERTKSILDKLVLLSTTAQQQSTNHTKNNNNTVWIGVLSTTGIYGNQNGNWVTETTPISKTNRFHQYETSWQKRCNHGAVTIFRCAGIYCNQQSALHTTYYNKNSSRNDDDDGITNRIHINDLANAVVQSMMSTKPTKHGTSTIYNLADDLPELRSVVMSYANQLLYSRTAAEKVSNTTDANATTTTVKRRRTSTERSRRRSSNQKRIDNTKMKQELLPRLQYPTYREGLQSIVTATKNSW